MRKTFLFTFLTFLLGIHFAKGQGMNADSVYVNGLPIGHKVSSLSTSGRIQTYTVFHNRPLSMKERRRIQLQLIEHTQSTLNKSTTVNVLFEPDINESNKNEFAGYHLDIAGNRKNLSIVASVGGAIVVVLPAILLPPIAIPFLAVGAAAGITSLAFAVSSNMQIRKAGKILMSPR